MSSSSTATAATAAAGGISSVNNSNNKTKPHISITLLGHVDSGKTQLASQLVYWLNPSYSHLKLNPAAASIALPRYHFPPSHGGAQGIPLVMKQSRHEQERGITMDHHIGRFETPRFQVTLIDSPGHRDFIKNTVSALSLSDGIGILVVAAGLGEFEAGFSSSGQTREHALLSYVHNVRHLIVCVNKMDDKSVLWSQKRYIEICDEVKKYLKKTGYKLDTAVSFVPCSGYQNQNVVNSLSSSSSSSSSTKPNGDASWYTGPSVVEAIDNFSVSNEELMERRQKLLMKPFRFSIDTHFVTHHKQGERLLVVTGRVSQGSCAVGDRLYMSSLLGVNKTSWNPCWRPRKNKKIDNSGMFEWINNHFVRVVSIQDNSVSVSIAGPSDIVGLGISVFPFVVPRNQISRSTLSGKQEQSREALHPFKLQSLLRRGQVISTYSSFPASVITEFTAHVMVLSIPNFFSVGYEPTMIIHEAHARVRITDITKIDKRTGAEIIDASASSSKTQQPAKLKRAEAGIITCRVLTNLSFEPFKMSTRLGSFSFHDNRMTVAAGIVLEIKSLDPNHLWIPRRLLFLVRMLGKTKMKDALSEWVCLKVVDSFIVPPTLGKFLKHKVGVKKLES